MSAVRAVLIVIGVVMFFVGSADQDDMRGLRRLWVGFLAFALALVLA